MRLKITNSQSTSNNSNRSILLKLFYLKRFIRNILPVIMLVLTLYYFSSESYKNLSAIVADKFYYYSTKFGFSLENIYLEGHNHTSQSEVIKKINLREKQSLFTINLKELKKKLEELPWVRYAIIDRQYPHTLMVHLIEKAPMAVLRNNKKYYLIDEFGEIIKEKENYTFKNLPVLVGQNAAKNFLDILPIISKDKELYDNIILANWIGNRRWNIVFLNKIKVKLPEEHIAKAWDYVIKLYYENKLSNMDLTYIDLRIEDKIYLR